MTKDLVSTLPDLRRACRWVKPDQYHVTLKFMGDCPDSKLAGLKWALDETARRHSPFPLHLQKVGSFNQGKAFKVLWVGTAEGTEPTTALALDIQRACQAIGFSKDSAQYHPHVTLARSKAPIPIRAFDPALKELAVRVIGPMDVKMVSLIESVLSPQGPAYTTLYRVPLSGSGKERYSDSAS